MTRTETLKVPGATLHYEVRGSGPVLLMIPGGPMDADGFAGVAPQLADRYTVVTFDPRGLSRSRLDTPADGYRIGDAADDAHRLLDAVGGGPADVLASSGGAFPALELVARHPEQVRTLVAHEPPLTELLPDRERHRREGEELREIHQREGAGAAIAKFMEQAGFTEGGEDGEGAPGEGPQAGALPEQAEPPPDELTPETQAARARMQSNLDYFFGHMLAGMAGYLPDFGALQAAPARIVVAVGETRETEVAHRAAAALAERLGQEPVVFPGDHGGFTSQPAAFAAKLHEVLGG